MNTWVKILGIIQVGLHVCDYKLTLTALVLMSYIYGNFVSRDWYSGDAHVTRPWGSMFNPRRVRYIVLL